MKNLMLLILLMGITVNGQVITTPQEDKFQISIWTDVFSGIHESTIPQIGVEVSALMYWGWVSVGVSYFDLHPSYSDFVVQGGMQIHLFNFTPVRYYAGPRIGVEFRENNPHPMVGAVAGFDWEIAPGFIVGLRAWFDYRSSQDNQFYGDDTAYEPGIIINNPMTQESGAIVISHRW